MVTTAVTAQFRNTRSFKTGWLVKDSNVLVFSENEKLNKKEEKTKKTLDRSGKKGKT